MLLLAEDLWSHFTLTPILRSQGEIWGHFPSVVLLGRETVSTYLKAYSDTRMISTPESGCLRNNEGLLPAHAAASPLSPPWLGSSVKWNL